MIVFDEYSYAMDLENQEIDNTYNIIKKGTILAKLYFNQGLSEDEVYKRLCKKLIILDKSGNYDIKHSKINIMIATAKNNKKLKSKEICFSKLELEKIHQLNDEKLEIFAFVMLCLFKFNDNNKFYVNEREVIRLCNGYWCGTLFNNMISRLYDEGIIKLNVNKIKGTISQKIVYEFTDDFINETEEKELIIRDYRNLNNQYLRYFNPNNYIECEKCSIVIPKKNNRQKYCKECI